MKDLTYRYISERISLEDFSGFSRYQDVKRCYRKIAGEWVLRDIAFVEEWSEEDYRELVCLMNKTIGKGGKVIFVCKEKDLAGFGCLENELFGSKKEYLQLSFLYVSSQYRGLGIGRKIFLMLSESARELGGKKLYISAHSAEESQRFYRSLNCREAQEYDKKLFELEPCDVHMEYIL